MPLGPMEYVVFEFDGNEFGDEVASTLQEVVANGVLHVADLIFAKKDHGGDVTVLELSDLGDATAWKPVMGDLTSLFSLEDIEDLTKEMRPNSAAAIVLFEHSWAAKLHQAIVNRKGRLVADGFVSAEAVEDVLRKRHRPAA